jgi:hypothetical protein
VFRLRADPRRGRNAFHVDPRMRGITSSSVHELVLPLIGAWPHRLSKEVDAMILGYELFAASMSLLVLILVWRRLRSIETKLKALRAELNQLHSRLMLMALNADHSAAPPIVPTDAPLIETPPPQAGLPN